MTQNEKDLLLKDLCARLPYGVKVQVDNHCWVDFRKDIPVKLTLDNSYRILLGVTLGYVKPCLFPLSSMSEEQKKELDDITNLDIEIAVSHIKNDTPNYVTSLNRLNWLLKNHFDIYDLIPIGLAEDATGKNIY